MEIQGYTIKCPECSFDFLACCLLTNSNKDMHDKFQNFNLKIVSSYTSVFATASKFIPFVSRLVNNEQNPIQS